MAKRVVPRPDWLQVPGVQDIYSVSNCMSPAFMDYLSFWRHNGYWFFDHPGIIRELARESLVGLGNLTFFYYEVYEREFDGELRQWRSFQPSDFPTRIIPPANKDFQGFDVVTFSLGTSPECSPLSCNHLASLMQTNSHCLLGSFEDATTHLEAGRFDQGEPGPFRIFAVYAVDPNTWHEAPPPFSNDENQQGD